MSGYQIISLRNTLLYTGGATMMLDGIYDQIESNNRKPILLDDIIIDDIERPAVYACRKIVGDAFVFDIYGKRLTITDTDAVSVTNTSDTGVGSGEDYGD